MTIQGWLQIALTFAIGFLLSIPTSRYLACVVTGRHTLVDPVFDRLDNFLYWLIGRGACTQAMNWKSYTVHMLVTNLIMGVIIYLILVFQNYLPLNRVPFSRDGALAGVQYGGELHHEYGLAGL